MSKQYIENLIKLAEKIELDLKIQPQMLDQEKQLGILLGHVNRLIGYILALKEIQS